MNDLPELAVLYNVISFIWYTYDVTRAVIRIPFEQRVTELCPTSTNVVTCPNNDITLRDVM